MSQIQNLPIITPEYTDYDITIDSNDSNLTKRTQIGAKVKKWLENPAITADDLRDWSTNKILTATERTKLAGIDTWAQVNLLERVNWQTGSWPSKNLNLNLDDIPDWVLRKAWSVPFWAWESSQLSTAYVHSQQVTGNPHNVTPSQIGLGLVANERQLSREPWNFNALPERSDIQREFNDTTVIQDAFDSDIIKKVSVWTQFIWYASNIQLWRPSVFYHAETFVSSTTYEIRSIVINEWDWSLYYCLVPHLSSWSFATDLANWYWMLVIAGWGWSSPVYVIHWVVEPSFSWFWTPSWAFAWQLYANEVTGNIWVWDGNDWILNSAWGGWGWSWIVYSLSNWVLILTTIGNRWLASTWTLADKTYETSQEVDPLTGDTTNMNFTGGTVTYTDVTQNYTAPVQLSCEWSVSFGVTYWLVANTDFVRVQVTNTAVQYTINKSINTWTTTYNLGSWVVSVTVSATDVTVTDISWVNTLDTICYYRWNIINHDGTIVNNTNVTVYNTGTNTYNDVTTNVYGWTYNNITVNNLTLTGGSNIQLSLLGMNESIVWDWAQTVFTLVWVPVSEDLIWVFIAWGLYQSDLAPWLDYTFNTLTNEITFTVAPALWQTIYIKWIRATGNVAPAIKKVAWATWTWPTNTVNIIDADCLPWSIITWWTVTAGTQIGFWEFVMWTGSFDINSTAVESWITFNYAIII